jgi:hypothetical protein
MEGVNFVQGTLYDVWNYHDEIPSFANSKIKLKKKKKKKMNGANYFILPAFMVGISTLVTMLYILASILKDPLIHFDNKDILSKASVFVIPGLQIKETTKPRLFNEAIAPHNQCSINNFLGVITSGL